VFARARPDLASEGASEGSLVIAGASAGPTLSWREALARAAPQAAPYAARPEDPAFWLYSSGTTGKPKGIMHAHRSLLTAGQAQREVIGLAPGERSFATSKLFFAYALEHGLLGPLAIGATAVLEPDWPDAETVLARSRATPARGIFQRAHLLPPPARAGRRRASRRSATFGASSRPAKGCPRSSSRNGARQRAESSSPSTACRKPSAPAW
jgi:non-ribosomal peptide synthetase component E (peptide arylation enzyme)